MTRKQIAVLISKLEGNKSQARIGDIQEILKLLCALDATYRVDQALKKKNTVDLAVPSKLLNCLATDAQKMAVRAHKKMLKKKK